MNEYTLTAGNGQPDKGLHHPHQQGWPSLSATRAELQHRPCHLPTVAGGRNPHVRGRHPAYGEIDYPLGTPSLVET